MPNCAQKTKGAYIYSSLPVARPSKTAYRNEARPPITLLEADPDQRLPLTSTPECVEFQDQLTRKRAMNARKFIHKVAKTGDTLESHIGPSSVCFGRSTAQVQTGLYLEELRETVETDDFWCQTDQFLDRPPSPVFVPAKVGVDVGTQIEAWELFDFNIEVRPILEVLVGKTVEQSLLEVMEEEELAELRRQQAVLQEIHNADLDEIARLEERNRRYREEQARRKCQAERAHILRQETADKIAARCFVKAYLEPLLPSTFGMLLQNGYFYDNIQNEIETYFYNELIESVLDNHVRERRARILVDGIINQAVSERYTAYREAGRELMTEKLIERSLPGLARKSAAATINHITYMAIDRMEMTSDARNTIVATIQTELMNEILTDAASEVFAHKEAEKRALEAEQADY